MQDTAGLRYLLKRRRGEPNGADTFAFGFDGVDDYIFSPTIGRTGYNMNVFGNVTTGSDGDGDYFGFTLTPQSLLVATTVIPALTRASAFSYAIKIKTGSDVTTTQIVHNNVISASNRVTLSIASGELRVGIYNGTSYVGKKSFSVTTNTTYVIHYTRDGSSVGKLYLAGVEQTNVPIGDPTSSGTLGFSLSNAGSGFLGQVYFFAGWNKALTKSEIDADIALGNTTKQDPSIVAYYVPENIQFNTDYITTKDFSNAARTKTGTTVTSGIADIRGGTNAYTLTMSAGAGNGATITNNSLTGATLSSKVFRMKVFAWTASGTATMRLRISHNGVSTYYGSDQTVTTTPQEFTFTKALTSSTSGTGMTYGIEVGSAAGAATINVFYPTDWLTNQTLRDESPNIGGFIGRKTPLVMSARVKLGADAFDTVTSQVIFKAPRHYLQIMGTTNIVNRRSETTLQERIAGTAGTAILGNGNRNKVNIVVYKYRDGTGRLYETYVNGVKTTGGQTAYSNTIRPSSTIYTTQLLVGRDSTAVYYNGNIRDARIYTFTGSFTNADALSIYNGGEPISAGVTKYLHYRPPVVEVGTTTQDQSPNVRDGTLNGGVTRDYI